MTQGDGFDKLYQWYVGDDEGEALLYEIEKAKSRLAEVAYNLRIQYGLSIEELSGITGIDPQDIDELEEGDYPGKPRDELIHKIEGILGDRFGVKSSNLLTGKLPSLSDSTFLTAKAD